MKYKIIQNHIIEIPISYEILQLARNRTRDVVVNTNRTVIGGNDAWLTGNLGEEIFQDVFRPNERHNTFDYDFIWNGSTIDIKSHSGKLEPNVEYNVNIMSYTISKQNTENYCFFRISSDLTKAWVLGTLKKKNFILKSTFHPKGEKTTNLVNNFEYKADQLSLKVKELKSMIEYLK